MKIADIFTRRHAIFLLLILLFTGFSAGCLGQDPMEARVDSLVRELGNEDGDARLVAVYALIDIGEPAVPSLIKALGDRDANVRELSAFAIGRIGDQKAVEALSEALSDPEPEVRRSSAHALGRIGDKSAVEALSKALSDPEPEVRGSSARALGILEAPEATGLLIPLLQYEDDEVVLQEVVVALRRLKGPGAASALLEVLDHENEDVRREVVISLGELGDPVASEALLELFDEEELGYTAASAFGNLRSNQTVEKLTGLLDSRDPIIRANAVKALGNTEDPAVIPPLIEMLEDPALEVRKEAAHMLGTFGYLEAPGAEKAVTPLIRALEDRDEDVRISVIYSLGSFGDEEAVLPLISLLGHKDAAVRKAAAYALGRIGDPRAVEALTERVETEENWLERRIMAETLIEIGGTEAVEPLIMLLEDKDYRIRQSAAMGLGKLRATEAVDALLEALETERERVVRQAEVSALGEIGDKRAAETLRQLSTDRNEYRHVREAAGEALGKLEAKGEANASLPPLE
ncbi:MAG: HEAT repeat domain-containing protein [Methanosarcinaceae archaeon]|nr:HEAT repeat domain-containing protein [Methanosarcinaceae archaeon]MDD4496957.1 HEAT repeat domain-containing protein [Methanosarcinaceae archaeon]